MFECAVCKGDIDFGGELTPEEEANFKSEMKDKKVVMICIECSNELNLDTLEKE